MQMGALRRYSEIVGTVPAGWNSPQQAHITQAGEWTLAMAEPAFASAVVEWFSGDGINEDFIPAPSSEHREEMR